MSSIPWRPSLSVEADRSLRGLRRLRWLVSTVEGTLAAKQVSVQAVGKIELYEVAVVRAFSLLESYLSSRADSHFRTTLPLSNPPKPFENHMHDLVAAARRKSFEQGVVKYWEVAAGVAISRHPEWAQVKDVRELRNAITHGMGYVRPGGGSVPASVLGRLRSVTTSPATYTGKIPVTQADWLGVSILVENLVKWADASV